MSRIVRMIGERGVFVLDSGVEVPIATYGKDARADDAAPADPVRKQDPAKVEVPRKK